MIPPEILYEAYTQGFFPMADSQQPEKIEWYSPQWRAVFPLYDIVQPRSLRKFIEKHNLKFTINFDFEFVIKQCSQRETTWISKEIIDSYIELYKVGYAHSIETWLEDEIVGGLYGVAIGGAFFGESMFNTISNGAKAAFFYLIEHLKKQKFVLLDSQFINDFTMQLGAIEIHRELYLSKLKYALTQNCVFIE